MPFTPEDNLRLAIGFGLVKGRGPFGVFARSSTRDDRTRVAEAIREHLAWRDGSEPARHASPSCIRKEAKSRQP
jgi:hypothetical protein